MCGSVSHNRTELDPAWRFHIFRTDPHPFFIHGVRMVNEFRGKDFGPFILGQLVDPAFNSAPSELHLGSERVPLFHSLLLRDFEFFLVTVLSTLEPFGEYGLKNNDYS